MSKDSVTMTAAESDRLDFIGEHRKSYIESGGTEGHILDLTDIGGRRFTTHLLLETKGRKTGAKRLTPLIYADIGGEVVIVASKGGADVHPAWYLNLAESKDCRFQIGTQAFSGTWRSPEGAERDAVWAFMEGIYPPYTAYKKGTARDIPLVMMTAIDPIDVFKE